MEADKTTNLEVLKAERDDVKKRSPIIIEILRNNLQDTALVQNRPFVRKDIEKAKNAYLQAAPFAHPRLFPSLWEHLLYSAIMARKIAWQVGSGELQPREAEVLAFVGDDGSLAVPHRYYRKNVVNELFDKYIGVRPELLAKQPSVPEILGRRKAVQNVSNMSLPQIVLDVVDNIGKINNDGSPRTLEQTINYNRNQPQRYAGGVWPSERFGLKALASGKQEFAIKLFEDEIHLLKNQYGINIKKVIQDSFAEYQQIENQEWLRAVKQAHETLDPNVDRLLNRPKVQTIVFDAGGVLMKDADPALVSKLANYFGCSNEQILSIFDELNPDAFANKISEEEYLRKFWQALDKDFPESLEEARIPFVQPEIFTPMEGMQELVEKLSRNSQIELYVLSDSIHAITPTMMSWIRRAFPWIPANNILISSQISTSKREGGSLAFKVLLNKLGNPNPQSVLFIDDKEPFATNARAQYNLRAINFRENDPERLRQELEKGGYI